MPKPKEDSYNYSFANEDSRIEQAKVGNYSTLFAICGSGARVLPLLNSSLKGVEVVDRSSLQLAYLKFKLELFRSLEPAEIETVLGYTRATKKVRQEMIAAIHLSQESKIFLARFEERYLAGGFIFLGKWESFLRSLSRTIRLVLQVDFAPIFAAKDLEAQREQFLKIWPQKRLALLLKIFANKAVFNFLHYSGSMGGKESLAKLLLDRFQNFFWHHKASTSFLLQFLFLGEVPYREGWPLEVTPECIHHVKNFTGEIKFKKMDMLEALATSEAGFYSLSDVVSYLDSDQQMSLERILLKKLQADPTYIVSRSFLRPAQFSPGIDKYRDLDYTNFAQSHDSSVVYNFDIFSN